MLSGELGRGWVSASLAVGLVLPSCLWVAETTKRLLMEPPGPFRAALVGPLLLLLLPLLLPLSGPAVSAQMNFEALIIAMSVVGGILLLGITVCCCCCCRKRKSQRQVDQEATASGGLVPHRILSFCRRAEMKSRHEEIRKKYGEARPSS
uniref:PTTG1 interacting protein n=1 Tax=Monodelphis domestica TaxID=13616 RepID=A0A5F8HF44_MONDO